MKIRNPKSRFNRQIGKKEFVLEVGGENNPHPRANVVVDKFPLDNTHRCGNLKVLKKQGFMVADGEDLPFKNKEFDYVISCHVLEHVENPAKFLDELSRVGKRGYLETPSLIGEYLIPKKSHKWVILELKEKIVLMKKEDIGFKPSLEFGDLLQKYVAPNSIEFRLFMRAYPDLFTVRYEWKDSIDYVVNPKNPKLRSFFISPWDEEKILTIVKRKSKFEQIISFLLVFTEMTFGFAKSILRKIRSA
jgi:ubiquinone/menaquinone biosynthesis C-methylase UbiE